jgi:hypothetical protein
MKSTCEEVARGEVELSLQEALEQGNNQPAPLLTLDDLAKFERFGVDAALLQHVRRVTDEEARAIYGLTYPGNLSGVVFEYPHPLTGQRVTMRLRRDNPEVDSEGKIQNKYVSPCGDNRHLYFPPGAAKLLSDIAVPVVPVEAEKSVLALSAFSQRCGYPMLPLGTGGCWGWHGKTGIESGPNGQREEVRGPLPDFGLITWKGRKAVIIFDANVSTNLKVQAARTSLAQTLAGFGAEVFYVDLPQVDGVNGPDDAIELLGDKALLALLDSARRWHPTPSGFTTLKAVSAREFLALDIPPRKALLSPILFAQSLVMLHGTRGYGKTHLGLGIAVAVASGKDFLRWKARESHRVLFVDGELPQGTLQGWVAEAIAAAGAEEAGDNLKIITPDMQEFGIPDLATLGGQAALQEHVEAAELIVLDNLSALVRSGKENDAESWLPIQGWALGLRRQGKSIVFVHHSGRSGEPRGTSKREDLLDLVIALRHPPNYKAAEGLRTEVHFTKTRGIFGKDAEAFEVSMATGEDGVPVWTMKDVEVSARERAMLLFEQGCDVLAVEKELGVSRATAFRYKNEWKKSQRS